MGEIPLTTRFTCLNGRVLAGISLYGRVSATFQCGLGEKSGQRDQPRLRGLTRVFPGRESVVTSGSVAPPSTGWGQAQREQL